MELSKNRILDNSENNSLIRSLEMSTRTVVNLSKNNNELVQYIANQENRKTIECPNNSGTIEINNFNNCVVHINKGKE
jgi:hypothetical protein